MAPMPLKTDSRRKDVPESSFQSDPSLDDQRKYFLEMQAKREKFVDEFGFMDKPGTNKNGCMKLGNQKQIPSQPRTLLTKEERYEALRNTPGVIINAARAPIPLPHTLNVNIHFKYLKQVRDMEIFNDDRIIELPELDFECDPAEYESLKKGAALAIGEYNSNERTNYRFVAIERVHTELISGIRYYMIFRAKMNNVVDTFHAMVRTNRVERAVEGIKIKKPGSPWYKGTFRELRK